MMTAKEKIEKLTDGWYGYTLFASLVSLFQNGIGFFSLAFTVGSTLFSLFITFLVGRWLLARSSLGRFIVLCVSGIGLCVGALATAKYGMAFLSDWSIGLLLQVVLFAAGVLMNLRSLRTLTDSSVKAFFRS